MSDFQQVVVLVLVGILLAAIVFCVQTVVLFYCWNMAIAPVFKLSAITAMQSACFVVVLNVVGACFRTCTNKKA